MESDREVDNLVESILSASEKYKLPAFIETHRATITQDMWRTVELTKRFPEIYSTETSATSTAVRKWSMGISKQS